MRRVRLPLVVFTIAGLTAGGCQQVKMAAKEVLEKGDEVWARVTGAGIAGVLAKGVGANDTQAFLVALGAAVVIGVVVDQISERPPSEEEVKAVEKQSEKVKEDEKFREQAAKSGTDVLVPVDPEADRSDPDGVSDWALIDGSTGEVKAIITLRNDQVAIAKDSQRVENDQVKATGIGTYRVLILDGKPVDSGGGLT